MIEETIGDRSETTMQKLWQALLENDHFWPVKIDEYDVYAWMVPHPAGQCEQNIEGIDQSR